MANPLPRILSHVVQRLPLIAYAARCLEEERHKELALLGVNLLMAIMLGLLVFGYPFLNVLVLVAAAVAGLVILSATGV